MKDFGDAQAWESAVHSVIEEFEALPDQLLEKAGILSAIIKKQKSALHELTRSVYGEAVCEICRGGCCKTGKYHFTATDLLAYLFDGKQLFTPDFGNGHCPFLGNSGCLMEAEYRPFNCVTFNCERIERLLRQTDVDKFYELEKGLRVQYALMEKLFGNIFAYGLLANFERNGREGGILLQQKVPRWVSGGWNDNCLQ
jgi:hypothetical protein